MKARTIAAFLVSLIVVVFVAQSAIAQGPWSQFDGVLADQVVATESITAPDVNVSDDLAVTDAITAASLVATGSVQSATANVTGNATVGGTLGVTGALAASTNLNIVPQSVITVTQSGVITPTGTVQLIQAAGTVTSGDIAAGTSGQLLILINIVAQAITIPDSGNQLLSAGIVLNQWDTLTLVFYGSKWIQLSTSNN